VRRGRAARVRTRPMYPLRGTLARTWMRAVRGFQHVREAIADAVPAVVVRDDPSAVVGEPPERVPTGPKTGLDSAAAPVRRDEPRPDLEAAQAPASGQKSGRSAHTLPSRGSDPLSKESSKTAVT